MKRALVVLCAVGCADPTEGTFVGNPTFLARYVDNDAQVGVGGRLVTTGTALEPCAGATISLGPQELVFSGSVAMVELELPDDVPLCGVRMAVTQLAVSVDDAGVAKSVVGQDFDLVVPSAAIPPGAERLVLELGDAHWLPAFLPLAPAGETHLNDEADPALVAAFFDGLDAGSSFVAEDVP